MQDWGELPEANRTLIQPCFDVEFSNEGGLSYRYAVFVSETM